MSDDTDQQHLAAIAAAIATDQERLPKPPEAAQVAAQVIADIDAALVSGEAAQTRRGYLGASAVGQECERALWYSFRWAARPTFPPRILRRFDRGHRKEARVFAWLEAAGYEVRPHDPLTRGQFSGWTIGGIFGGHLDGFVRGGALGPDWCLLEGKALGSARYRYHEDEPIGVRDTLHTSHEKADDPGQARARARRAEANGSWWRLHKRGVKKERVQHYAQMQAYMALSHPRKDSGGVVPWGLDKPVTRALYVAVNTDTDQLHVEVIPFELGWWRRIRARALRMLRAQTPPARIQEIPAFPPCSWCDYKDVCHGVAQPERHCRSCKHAELRLPGDPGTRGDTAQWFCTLHQTELGTYAACPQWDPIHDVSTF